MLFGRFFIFIYIYFATRPATTAAAEVVLINGGMNSIDCGISVVSCDYLWQLKYDAKHSERLLMKFHEIFK